MRSKCDHEMPFAENYRAFIVSPGLLPTMGLSMDMVTGFSIDTV